MTLHPFPRRFDPPPPPPDTVTPALERMQKALDEIGREADAIEAITARNLADARELGRMEGLRAATERIRALARERSLAWTIAGLLALLLLLRR